MADELPQWDIEIKEIPVEGDKVSVCGIDFVFGSWSPDENYTTPYNVQIENTVGRCCANLVAAINGADSKFGGGHLNRYISSVKASYLGRFAHIQMRNLTDNGSGVEVTASAGDRITVTAYEGNIPGGGGGGGGDEAVLVKKTVTENGTYNASDDNADGYHQVTVNVVPVLGTKEINTNGTYNASSDSLQGFSSVTVNVAPNVTTKSISENGTYNASSDSVDGYSKVTVNVLPNVISKSITANGEYSASSDSVDGYSSVSVSVPEKTIGTDKIVSTNGEYIASSDNVDGYSSLIVKVDNPLLTPYYTDYGDGYIGTGSATMGFIREHPSNCYSDIYLLTAGRSYLIYIDTQSRSRFRIMTTRVNPLGVSGNITAAVEEYEVLHLWDGASGSAGIYDKAYTILEMEYTGFLIIQKTNTGQTGLKSYVIDKDYYINPPSAKPVIIVTPQPVSINYGTSIGVYYGKPMSIPVVVQLKYDNGNVVTTSTEPYPFENPTGIADFDGGYLYAQAFEDSGYTTPASTVPTAGTYYIKIGITGNTGDVAYMSHVLIRGCTLEVV